MLNVVHIREDQTQDQGVVVPVRIVKAHSIAHLEVDAGARADMAADWVVGHTIVVPTVKLAGHVFQVSEQLVAGAAKSKGRPRSTLVSQLQCGSQALACLVRGWSTASKAECEAFCALYEAEVWGALENVEDAARAERLRSTSLVF